jgi:hypothetical protein
MQFQKLRDQMMNIDPSSAYHSSNSGHRSVLKIKSPRKPSDDVSTVSGRTDEVAGRTDEMTDEMTPGSGYNSLAPSTRATSSATSTRSYKEVLLGSETTKK